MKKKKILCLLLPAQILLIQFLGLFPAQVDFVYSRGLYPVLAKIERTVLGWLPFSLGDILYLISLVLVFRWLIRKRKTWRQQWKENLLQITATFSVVYFVFHVLWGLNYYRTPLREHLHLETEVRAGDLQALTLRLIDRTNALQEHLARNPNKAVVFPYDRNVIYGKSTAGYRVLAQNYPEFTYGQPSIKGSLWSLPLTYMGFSGYLNPFTGEAQVNDRMPLYGFPVTVCHEMAHQLGYAAESEANFIGFLSAKSNPDPYFQYAAYAFALRYCLNTFEMEREGSAKRFLPKINKGVLENYRESREFWEQHQTFIETGFKLFYDRFLKLNQQKDGMEGYGRFVGLLVNYYRNKPL